MENYKGPIVMELRAPTHFFLGRTTNRNTVKYSDHSEY